MGEELTVEILKQLPLATVAIIACIALWRTLSRRTDDHIKDLREGKEKEIADLRARIMVIEDNLHVPRVDRFKYLPNLEFPKAGEIKELD